MKNWLKKAKNKEIIDILEDRSSKRKIYSVPKDLDALVKFNLKKISEEIKSEKKKYNIFFTPKLAFGYSLIILIIIGVLVFNYTKFNFPGLFRVNKLNKCLVTFLDGKAYLVNTQYNNISELKAGSDVNENDIIKTEKDSTIELQVGEGSLIRVKENSVLKIVKLFKDKELEETRINLDIGKILAKPKGLTEGSSFEIETKSITAGVRGTEFTVIKTVEGITKIAVNEGEVRVVKNIKSKDIDNIKKIDKALAEDLDNVLEKEVILKKDEKIDVNDSDYNSYKEQTLSIIEKIAADMENNKDSKEKLESVKKEVEENRLKDIQKGADKLIIKKKVTNKEWQSEFNRKELNDMGVITSLSKETIENKKEEKNTENKINGKIEKKESIKVEKEAPEKKEQKQEELPVLYKNDFEKGLKGIVSDGEWQITADKDNNHVLVPASADINSDAFFRIKESENFILQFRFKRFPNKDKACWIAIDLGIDRDKEYTDRDNDWVIPANDEIRFGNRLNGKKYKTIKYNLEFNKWYNFKLIVEAGKRFYIYIDNKLVLSYNKLNKDIVKYNYIKFEGNPTLGKWYLDDIYFETK